MEEYLRLLMEQIRCRKAHPYIREEIQGHIQDQIEDNMLAGMSKEEAERAAVEDMGSPVEAGIALDRIHRPRMAWGMVVLMGIISVAAIIFHVILSRQIAEYSLTSGQIDDLAVGSSEFVRYTIIGFILMLVVYRIDYSVIARYARILVVGLMVMAVVMNVYLWEEHHKLLYEIAFPMILWCVPLFGAVIYQYHGQGYGTLLKSVLWLMLPVIIAYRMPSLSLTLMLLISMLIVLTIAIALNWFKVSRRIAISALWGGAFGLPIIGLVLAYFFGGLLEYQKARIVAFFIGSEEDYLRNTMREIFQNSNLFGNNEIQWIGHVPEFNSRYMFSYLLSSYGIICGMLVLGILVVVIYKVFSISLCQKNQLGMCMGCGCGIVLLYNLAIHMGENFGFLPVSQNFLPFFSSGGGSIIVCYIMMGIILSIYRYKNIYPKHIDIQGASVKLTLDL